MRERLYFIDWVRVLAFFLLIFFHCAMPFTVFGWEIKDTDQSVGLSRLIWWLHQWRLPLLFFAAGVGTHFSLRKRSIGSFAGERTTRLLIPVIFAMLFTIPFQVYFEWRQEGKISGSYTAFYPRVWQFVPYPDGALTWSHLWFVVYLYVYSMLLLPIFGLFKIRGLQFLKSRFVEWLGRPFVVVWLALPLIGYYFSLFIRYPEQLNLVDDWFVFVFSLTLFVYGYLLGGSERFWAGCERYRYYWLGGAVVCIALLYYGYWWNLAAPGKRHPAGYRGYGVLNAVHVWLWILAAFGFARKHLNKDSRFLRFMNTAVYPFYILHQTVIVAAGYYIVQWRVGWGVKFLLLAAITFAAIYSVYRWLIRPFMLPRLLFGVKLRETHKKTHLSEPLVAKK